MNITVITPSIGIAPAIPWYQSPQLIGLITTIVSAAIAIYGPKLNISSTDITTVVTDIFGVIALIAPIIGTVLRIKSTVQPVTLTQAAADVHPNTIASGITQHVP
jgi:hypothetical protein